MVKPVTDKKKIQMADIARLAGVSTATVSRALNGSPLINEETRQRIQELAKSLSYTINMGAQSLRRGGNRTIGVVIPYNATNRQSISDPFFLAMLGSLADALTELEPGAAGTVLYPSGVAAIAGALLAVLRPGDVLLMTDNAYEPSRTMASGLLKDMGIETRWFDPLDPQAFAAAACERTRAVLLESPGSLTLEVQDVPALSALARERGIAVVLDNTWAGPLGFPALERGADITVMSLTKHVGGHSDLMLGSAAAGEKYYARLRRTAQALGQVVSPDDAALALRGLRTMSLRLERETASVLALAQWLNARPEVARVLCPMLPGSPGHALWQRVFVEMSARYPDIQASHMYIDALTMQMVKDPRQFDVIVTCGAPHCSAPGVTLRRGNARHPGQRHSRSRRR